MVDAKAQSVILPSTSDREFFLIHGYTGSPTDFNTLAHYLHERFFATVKILRLPGHGTRISDLDDIEYHEFFSFVKKELEKELQAGKKIILGGVSFGAQLALILASKYPVSGVFHVCIPYRMRFPFNLSALKLLKFFKKYWKKRYEPKELEMRKGAFFYQHMHINALKISRHANRLLSRNLRSVQCPCFMVHSVKDSIGHFKSLKHIEKSIGSKVFESRVFDYEMKNHNIFFSPLHKEVYRAIGDFFEKNNVFGMQKKPEKVAAIIPSYNEGGRIGEVLRVLQQAPVLNEIIVVDDGSGDNTYEAVKNFPVKYLRNDKNMGKSYSMERGVASTDASIIFFCDADLRDLTPKDVEGIISPVLARQYDMFVGIRGNIMQKSFLPFAILSGDRAVRRTLWDALPKFYKHRYRIEVGLNYYAKFLGRGFGFKKFEYQQTLKETKYGFFQGHILRWRMNLDVAVGFFRAQCVDSVYWKWFHRI